MSNPEIRNRGAEIRITVAADGAECCDTPLECCGDHARPDPDAPAATSACCPESDSDSETESSAACCADNAPDLNENESPEAHNA